MAKMTKDEQIEVAERLQGKWLLAMERMLDAGTITSTDMATLCRWLMANGWSVDPATIPQPLKNKLIDSLGADAFDDLPVRLVR